MSPNQTQTTTSNSVDNLVDFLPGEEIDLLFLVSNQSVKSRTFLQVNIFEVPYGKKNTALKSKLCEMKLEINIDTLPINFNPILENSKNRFFRTNLKLLDESNMKTEYISLRGNKFKSNTDLKILSTSNDDILRVQCNDDVLNFGKTNNFHFNYALRQFEKKFLQEFVFQNEESYFDKFQKSEIYGLMLEFDKK